MDLNEYPETGLPGYLQHDLDAYREGLENGSSLLDCLWCELYSSINAAQIDDGAITPEHANYLRRKFLRLDVKETEENKFEMGGQRNFRIKSLTKYPWTV